MQHLHQPLLGIAHRQPFHPLSKLQQRIRCWIAAPQARAEQAPEGGAQGGMLRLVLVHDHRSANGGRAGGIGVLVLIRRLGEGHQNGGGAAHRQFAEAAGTGSADHQIGVLQQPGDVIAERAFHQRRVVEAAGFGVLAAAQMHHPATGGEQVGQHGAHHAVQAHGTLAAAHHHQERAIAMGCPVGQSLRFQELASHRRSGDQGLAARDPHRCRRQAHRHLLAEAPQQAGHPTGNGIGFMQNHRNAAPARRQDRRCGDVAPGGEHHRAPLASD